MLAGSDRSSAYLCHLSTREKREPLEKTGSTQLDIAKICKELQIPSGSPVRASEEVPPISLKRRFACRAMELPAVMASLQLKEKSCDEKSEDSTEDKKQENMSSRTLRKRTFSDKALLVTNSFKRQRVNLKSPEKLSSEKDVVDYYIKVNKNWRVKQTNLETIFEEPKESGDGKVVTMSGSKVRRSIAFSGRVTKAKKVKRNAKVKKFQLCKGKVVEEKKRKLTMDEVKLRLAALDSWPAILTEIGEEAQFSNI